MTRASASELLLAAKDLQCAWEIEILGFIVINAVYDLSIEAAVRQPASLFTGESQ
jgi:hypothetical protein